MKNRELDKVELIPQSVSILCVPCSPSNSHLPAGAKLQPVRVSEAELGAARWRAQRLPVVPL